jgi:Tryptophan-associated transmembrane protein (Trp_oprn_chp)
MASRRTFFPVVAAGVAGSGLAAYVSTRQWATPTATGESAASTVLLRFDEVGGQVPLATALALVGLAAWGVLLVTRGRVRWAVALLNLLAALGTLAAAISAWWQLPAQFRDDIAESGLDVGLDVAWSAWFPVGLVCVLLWTVASGLALRWARSWPEMASKYDAPTADAAPVPPTEQQPEDLWKALDEGRDPTAPRRPLD